MAALGGFWNVRNHQTEGRHRLAAALAGSESAPPAVRAKALGLGARFAMSGGDVDGAATLSEESLALFQEAGDPLGRAGALCLLSASSANRGDRTRAAALAEESLGLYRELKDRRGPPSVLLVLGCNSFWQGDGTGAGRWSKKAWRSPARPEIGCRRRTSLAIWASWKWRPATPRQQRCSFAKAWRSSVSSAMA